MQHGFVAPHAERGTRKRAFLAECAICLQAICEDLLGFVRFEKRSDRKQSMARDEYERTPS